MGSGQYAVGSGQWAVGSLQLAVVHGPQSTVHGSGMLSWKFVYVLAFFFTAKCTKNILFKLRRSLFWTSILFGARVVFQGHKGLKAKLLLE